MIIQQQKLHLKTADVFGENDNIHINKLKFNYLINYLKYYKNLIFVISRRALKGSVNLFNKCWKFRNIAFLSS